MSDEDLKKQMNTIINFAIRFNECNYVIVTDDNRCDYWKYYVGKYVEFMTNYEFNLLDSDKKALKEPEYVDYITNNSLLKEKGGACYSFGNQTIYIEIPYESTEYTLLRTLTHEYGHHIQNQKGYNISNCNKTFLEYHNIWLNENPNCRDTKICNAQTIGNDGFRYSYINKFLKFSDNTPSNLITGAQFVSDKPCDKNLVETLFTLEFNDFIRITGYYLSKWTHITSINGQNRYLLECIYRDMQNKKEQDKERYLLLFYNFLLGK